MDRKAEKHHHNHNREPLVLYRDKAKHTDKPKQPSRKEGKKPDRRRSRSRSGSPHRDRDRERGHDHEKRKTEEVRRKTGTRSPARTTRERAAPRPKATSREKQLAKKVDEAKGKDVTPCMSEDEYKRILRSRFKKGEEHARKSAPLDSRKAIAHERESRIKATDHERATRFTPTIARLANETANVSKPTSHRPSTPRAATLAQPRRPANETPPQRAVPASSQKIPVRSPQSGAAERPTRYSTSSHQHAQHPGESKAPQRSSPVTAGPSGYNQNLHSRVGLPNGTRAAQIQQQADEEMARALDATLNITSGSARTSLQSTLENERREPAGAGNDLRSDMHAPSNALHDRAMDKLKAALSAPHGAAQKRGAQTAPAATQNAPRNPAHERERDELLAALSAPRGAGQSNGTRTVPPTTQSVARYPAHEREREELLVALSAPRGAAQGSSTRTTPSITQSAPRNVAHERERDALLTALSAPRSATQAQTAGRSVAQTAIPAAQSTVRSTPLRRRESFAAAFQQQPTRPHDTARANPSEASHDPDDDLNRAIQASQITAAAHARQRISASNNGPQHNASPPRSTVPTDQANPNPALPRAVQVPQAWHMPPRTPSSTHRFQHDVVRIRGNIHPSAPLTWMHNNRDFAAFHFRNEVRYIMVWQIRITLNIRAYNLSDVVVDAVVDVELRLTDDQPQLDWEVDEL